MPRHARAPASVYAIFNYCVGASGVPASVLNIVGNQPLSDPMLFFFAIYCLDRKYSYFVKINAFFYMYNCFRVAS